MRISFIRSVIIWLTMFNTFSCSHQPLKKNTNPNNISSMTLGDITGSIQSLEKRIFEAENNCLNQKGQFIEPNQQLYVKKLFEHQLSLNLQIGNIQAQVLPSLGISLQEGQSSGVLYPMVLAVGSSCLYSVKGDLLVNITQKLKLSEEKVLFSSNRGSYFQFVVINVRSQIIQSWKLDPAGTRTMVKASQKLFVPQHIHTYRYFLYEQWRFHSQNHYILVSTNQIHFYDFEGHFLPRHSVKLIEENSSDQIISITKMNSNLLALSRHGFIWSIAFEGKNQTGISLCQIPIDENLRQIKYDDWDFRHFFVLGEEKIFKYHTASCKIVSSYSILHKRCHFDPSLSSLISSLFPYKSCTFDYQVLRQKLVVESLSVESLIFKNTSSSDKNLKKSQITIYEINTKASQQQKTQNMYRPIHLPLQLQNTQQNISKTKTDSMGKCQKIKFTIGNDIQINKKSANQYVLSHIKYFWISQNSYSLQNISQKGQSSQSLAKIQVEHLLIETEPTSNHPDSNQISNLRIPLIALSVGIILYMTMRNSNKKTNGNAKSLEEQQDEKIEAQIMRKIMEEKQKSEDMKKRRQYLKNNQPH